MFYSIHIISFILYCLCWLCTLFCCVLSSVSYRSHYYFIVFVFILHLFDIVSLFIQLSDNVSLLFIIIISTIISIILLFYYIYSLLYLSSLNLLYSFMLCIIVIVLLYSLYFIFYFHMILLYSFIQQCFYFHQFICDLIVLPPNFSNYFINYS